MDPTLPDLQIIRDAQSRIHRYLDDTPTIQAPDLEAVVGQPLWLKLENVQRTGSFKTRGALNWLLTATEEELGQGLITVSAGNHALALAWAASRQRVPVTVVMPEGSSPMKVRGTRALGAEVIIHGRISQAVEYCHRLREKRRLTLVHPYNDPRIMAGQGTVGLELQQQAPAIRRVLCPIGGGGLISGVGIALKALCPELELIGVEPQGAATMHNAWEREDDSASLASVDTWAASLAPAAVGHYTYRASRQVVDRLVTVSEAGIREATRRLLTEGHVYVEPGASVGLAALLEGQVSVARDVPTALIISGANLDPEQVVDCL